MKKIMDKLLIYIKFDKKYVFFSLTLVILGIITGSIFIVILNSSDKTLIVEYIQSFVESIKDNKINLINSFTNNLIINYLIIFVMCLIGFTYFLFPLNILILFYKSFIIGFSMSSFILTYKIKGIVLSICYILPHLIINILVFSLLTAFTLKLSLNMIKYIIKRKSVDMRGYFTKYLCIVFIFLILITITVIYESFIMPQILKMLLHIFI